MKNARKHAAHKFGLAYAEGSQCRGVVLRERKELIDSHDEKGR